MPTVLAHANDLAEKSLGNTDFTQHTGTFYVALFSAAPNADGSGGTELAAANGYARQAIAWKAVSNGAKRNSAVISFTASGADWSQATHFAIFTAVTAGTRVFWNALDAAVTVLDGETAEFAVDQLMVDFLPGVAAA